MYWFCECAHFVRRRGREIRVVTQCVVQAPSEGHARYVFRQLYPESRRRPLCVFQICTPDIKKAVPF